MLFSFSRQTVLRRCVKWSASAHGKGTRNMLSAHAPARKQELQSHEFHTAKEKETGGAALSLIGVDESGRSIGRCSAAVINKGCKRATNL